VGDELVLISPLKQGGALGRIPRTYTLEISGLYSSGHYDFDKQYLFVTLEEARRLSGLNLTGWHVWVHSIDNSQAVRERIKKILPNGWQVQDWTEFNSALFHSLKLEQWSMFLILSMAIFIAVMNIAITLMMHVANKKRNIGILSAIGANREQIQKIFLLQGVFLGGLGLLLGAVLTVSILFYATHFYEFPEIYYVRSVPYEIRPWSLGTIFFIASLLILLATYYPAYKASRLDPTEAIRQ
jgi:lipoprotein-releasing system permease protein